MKTFIALLVLAVSAAGTSLAAAQARVRARAEQRAGKPSVPRVDRRGRRTRAPSRACLRD